MCECDWCDCFFPMLHVLWLRRPQEMSLTSPWPIRIQTVVLRGYGTLRTLIFVEMCFLSWHLTPLSGNRISIRGTNWKHAQYLRVRSGEVVFYAIVHVVINTLQRCAPSFAHNRFVMYITHVHRYVCYVYHLVMYIISFLC